METVPVGTEIKYKSAKLHEKKGYIAFKNKIIKLT